MAFQHGYPTSVLVGAYDLSAYFTQAQTSQSTQTVDVTTFNVNSNDKTYIAGIQEGSLALNGIWEGDSGEAGDIDPVLHAALGVDTPVTVVAGGYATLGNRCWMLQSADAAHSIRTAQNDAVRIDATITANGGIRHTGRVLHPLAAETTTVNYTSLDNTAGTAFGGVGHLHVTAFTGTNGTIKIQHSPDNAAWADLITFTSVTAATSQRSVVTGTVDRYLRFAITVDNFTTMTVFASFARYTR